MPNLKKIFPVVALAFGLVVAMAGLSFAGPNAAAKITTAMDKSTGVKAGDTITLTVSVTGLTASTLTGFSAEVIYDTAAVANPTGTVKIAGAVGLPATTGTTTVAGYNRSSTGGGGILGGTLAATSTDLISFAFVTKTGFTTTNLALPRVILIAGTQRDTVAFTGAALIPTQINPPAPAVDLTPATASRNFNQTQVLTAKYTGAAGDTITWTASATVAGGNIRITAAADTIPGQIKLPLSLTATAATFRTKTAATGSTITLAASGTGKMTATIIVAAGTTRDTSTVIFDVPVPAELSSFAGSFADSKVMLNWAAVSQTNNAGWRILRSTDNEHFETISGIIPGAGTSNEQLAYTFTDVNLPAGAEKVYYVLEQVDLDGKVTRSRVAEVLLGGRFADVPKEFTTAIYPNPFNPATTIAYNLPDAAKVTVIVYDAIGQQIRTLINDAQTAAGRYTVQWDARDDAGRQVASGVYFAHITAGKDVRQQKMLLLK